ncbi:U2 small nuclear ribonucleoprotein A' [Sarcoptes scabiei]|uniref:Probable U2 small nuclear ribonucleoprotein A' n=1 Tax=Sarcoptes scabiei TaxID=52283 RepID=A0A834RCI7_SARSC|nr:U2 small nuclear ribonucleoprotein A' [Sarcoptes scabiei]UXI21777.1 Integrin alpha-PS1 [Sarcoptes scabiei]
MRLTIDLVEGGFQFVNKATGDRELDLRDYKISAIENLGATLNQFDSIDFTDNDIRKLENFPLLTRLKRLYLSNNRISKIDEQLAESLPNIEGLVLINNQIQELGDIDPLGKFKKLETLSMMGNPITSKKHYRLYVINQIPSLRLLDFKKIKMREREESRELFKGEKGRKLQAEIGIKSKTFVPGGQLAEQQKFNQTPRKISSYEEVQAIKEAISKASTLEEIERLKASLKTGQIPNFHSNFNKQN